MRKWTRMSLRAKGDEASHKALPTDHHCGTSWEASLSRANQLGAGAPQELRLSIRDRVEPRPPPPAPASSRFVHRDRSVPCVNVECLAASANSAGGRRVES